MRYLLLLLFACAPILCLNAQIPQSGIYQFNKNRQNFFGAAHYSSFFHSIDDFLSMQVIPYNDVSDYGLEYAVVAINAEQTQLKIAFLRDTVSTKGKLTYTSILKKNS